MRKLLMAFTAMMAALIAVAADYPLVDDTGAATEEALRDATCAFYLTSKAYPSPQGELVGSGLVVSCSDAKGARRIYLMSAKHVAAGIMLDKGKVTLRLGLKCKRGTNNVVRVEYAREKMKWIADEGMSDIALMDITEDLPQLKAAGFEPAAVDLDSRGKLRNAAGASCLAGVGTAPREAFGSLGIQEGSPVFALLGNTDLDIKTGKGEWQSPFEIRMVNVLKFNVAIMVKGCVFVQHLLDMSVKGGNSGSPVFVCGFVNGKPYPFLLGVVAGRPTDKLSAIMPIDGAYEAISHNHIYKVSSKPVDSQLRGGGSL